MTDRELLELAAKAAGKKIDIESFGEYQDAHKGFVVADGDHWNPLCDDGDALRLAVQLELEVSFVGDDEDGRDSQCCIGYPSSAERPCKISYIFEHHKGDIFAATRRAIVRAAAEIGKCTNYQSDSN